MSARAQTQFLKFLVAGGMAAGVNIGARFVLNLLLSYQLAIVLAYGCGMVTAFFLNKRFVFAQSALATRTQFVRFALINILALAQVWAVSVGLADWLFPRFGFGFHPHTVAHVAGVLVPVFTSYVGHRKFSFGQAANGARHRSRAALAHADPSAAGPSGAYGKVSTAFRLDDDDQK